MHKKNFIYAIYDKIVSKLSMLYMLSKFLSNLAHAEMNAKCPKTGFSATSLIQNRLLCVIKHLWELVCERNLYRIRCVWNIRDSALILKMAKLIWLNIGAENASFFYYNRVSLKLHSTYVVKQSLIFLLVCF